MLTESTITGLATRFPTLVEDEASRRVVARNGLVKVLDTGATLYHEGDASAYLPLIVAGELAVTKIAETGREITLYRVGVGQSCILSMLGILNHATFPATAEVSAGGDVILVPAARVRELVDRFPAWRQFVFSLYHNRLTSLITLVEEVVFQKLDVRLAALLLRHTKPESSTLAWTHQQIAVELGSSREVVSRVLKEWQGRSVLELSRGEVSVADRDALEKIAHSVT